MKYMFFSLVLAALCMTQSAHASLRTQIPDTNKIDFTAEGGRVLDLNDNESISLEPFIDLVRSYKAMDMSLIVIRVNKGPSEQYYDWQEFAKLLDPNIDPNTRAAVASRDFYIIELIDEKLFFNHLGTITQAQPNVPLTKFIKSYVDLYKAHLEVAQKNAVAQSNLAFCYAHMQKYNDAIPLLKAALDSHQLNPNGRAIAQLNLAFCYVQTQKLDDAIPLLKAALDSHQLTPGDHAIAQLNLAYYYKNTQDYAQAIPLYSAALEYTQLAPGDRAIAQLNLAICYAHMQNYKEAIPLLEATLESSQLTANRHAATQLDLAICYKNTQDYTMAVEFFKKSLESGNLEEKYISKVKEYLAECQSQLREKRTEHPTEASSSAKANHADSGQ